MVLLEAMGAGVPVVATRVGGVPDVLRAGVDGWLVPPEDPRRLAEVLEGALLDPSELEARGDAARARVMERYGRSVWVQRHVVAYSAAQERRERARLGRKR